MCDVVAPIGPRPGRPRWGALYASTLSQLTLFAMLEAAAPPHPVRVVARVVLTVGTFAAMAWWLRASRAAFDLQEWCACAPATIVVRVIASHPRPPARSIAPPVVLRADADELLHV
jgi:hypothetical protein